MITTLTVKGQVTIPKPIRDAMGLTPGTSIDFAVNRSGEVVLHKADSGKCHFSPYRVQFVFGI